MPIKDFRCKSCSNEFELIISNAADKPAEICPSCNSNELEQRPAVYAHYGFNCNFETASKGGNHRKFDGRDN